MKSNIISLVMVMGVLASLGAAPTSVYNQKREQVIVKEKVIQFGTAFKVIGIPVTDLSPEYYYKRSEDRQSTINEDYLAKKIAEELAKKLVELGIRPVNPNDKTGENLVIEKARELVDKRCGSCHSGDKPDGQLSFLSSTGALDLSDKTEKLTQPEIAWLMFSNTLDENMPKNGNKLNNDEIKIIHEYAKYLTKLTKDKQ